MHEKPTHVRTDGGPCFKHKDFAAWCKDKNIMHETSSPHHHESNGQADRAIREVKNLLKKTDAHMETSPHQSQPMKESRMKSFWSISAGGGRYYVVQ